MTNDVDQIVAGEYVYDLRDAKNMLQQFIINNPDFTITTVINIPSKAKHRNWYEFTYNCR